MAIITTELARIVGLGGEMRLEITWDDTLATIDPDSGEKHADTGDLQSFHIVNTSQRAGRLLVRRTNKAVWPPGDIAIAAGADITVLPFGPVQQINHANCSISLAR